MTDDIKKLKKEIETLKKQGVAVLGDSEVFVCSGVSRRFDE